MKSAAPSVANSKARACAQLSWLRTCQVTGENHMDVWRGMA